MANQSLFEKLSAKDPKLDPTKKTIIALGTACAVKYIQEKKMIHRVLKSLNLLFDSEHNPKLCDFGISHQLWIT
jgi:serine/threonine protein kinase